MPDETHIDAVQAERFRNAEQAVTAQLLRQLLYRLDPQQPDVPQDYPSLVRHVQAALERELSTWTSAPVSSPGLATEIVMEKGTK